MEIIEQTVKVTIRGFRVYVENQQNELYDFFVPTSMHRLQHKNVNHLIAENDEVLLIKRDNQEYEIAIDDVEQFGTKIN